MPLPLYERVSARALKEQRTRGTIILRAMDLLDAGEVAGGKP